MRAFLLTGALSVFVSVLQGLSSILITGFVVHYLKEADYIFWFLMTAAVPFAVKLDFGFGTHLTRVVALAKANKVSNAELSGIVWSLSIPPVAIAATALLVFLITAPYVLNEFGYSGDRLVVFNLFAIGVALLICYNMLAAPLVGIQRFVADRLIRITSTAVYVAIAGLLLKGGWGLEGIAIAFVANGAFGCVCSLGVMRKIYLSGKGHSSTQLRTIVEHVPQALDLFLTSIPALFIFNVAVWFVAKILEPVKVPEFSVVYQLGAAVTMLSFATMQLIGPTVSRLYVERNFVSLRRVVISNARIVLGLASLLAFIVVYNIEFLNQLWLSGKFKFEIVFLVTYLLVIVLEVTQGALTQAAFSTGYTRFAVVTWASALLICLGLSPALEYFGLAGAAYVIGAAQIITCHQRNIRAAARILGLDLWRNIIGDVVLRGASSCIPAMAVIVVVDHFVDGTPMLLHVILTALAGVVALSWMLRHDLQTVAGAFGVKV